MNPKTTKNGWQKFWKIFGLIFLVLAVIALLIYNLNFVPAKTTWGVTFSQQYTTVELGLDWKETYLAILDDLKVDHLRLSAYWNANEPQKGQYDFSDLDWQVDQASQRGVKIILAVGRRLPRWPECHDPVWLNSLSAQEQKDSLILYIKTVMDRYKNNLNIITWQIENEPYLSSFGMCPPPDREFFKSEVALAKQLTNKPILVTDTGELSDWHLISRAGGDILGTTLYRVVYNPYLGYFHWFTPPFYYWIRAQVATTFNPVQKVIVAELQGESWHLAGKNLAGMNKAESDKSMSLGQFQENISFASRSGFDEVYLWGVEWWYMLKTKQNDPSFWNEAKKMWPNK